MTQPLANVPLPRESVSLRRRLLAWAVDFAILVAAAAAIGWLTYTLAIDSLRSVADMGTIGVSNFMSNRRSWAEFATSTGMDVARNMRVYALGGLGTLLFVATIYFWVSIGLANRTLGMAAADVRLGRARVPSVGPGWTHSSLWALLRAITDIGVFAAACAAPMFGAFGLAFALWVISVAWLLFNGFLAARSGFSLNDRLGGVVLVPAGGFANAARVARGAAGAATAQAQTLVGQAHGIAVQVHANSPQQVRHTLSAAGQVGRQAVDRTRQAMESERAAQTFEAGRRAAQRGRRFAEDLKRHRGDRPG